MQQNEFPKNLQELREMAETILRTRPIRTLDKYREEDLVKIIHELDIYKIEVELQQEELKKTKAVSAAVSKAYLDLYEIHHKLLVHFMKNGKPAFY